MISMQTKWRNHINEHKTLFVTIAVGLLLLEVEIFAMAAMKSGRETALNIMDARDNVVFTVKGNRLDNQSKADFERTFGPLANYQVRVITRERPFPFRAWFAAAVGLPVSAVLLFGFFVKAWESLFIRAERSEPDETPSRERPTGRLERLLARISRLNIFILGAAVLALALGLWAGPYLIAELGRISVATIARYKWVVLGAVMVFLGLVIWIIYLRYRLAAKSIEMQADVEKFRLQLEMTGNHSGIRLLNGAHPPRLEGPPSTDETPAGVDGTDSLYFSKRRP
jgi:hypothetical protein